MSSSYYITVHRIALDAAKRQVVVPVDGNYIQIVSASNDAATIGFEVAGDSVNSQGVLKLQNRDFVRFPDKFNRVMVTSDAQPGDWVDVMFMVQNPPPNEFEYVRGQRTTVDSIAEPIRIDANQKITADGGSTRTTGQITLTTTPQLILAANTARKSWRINNTNSTNPGYRGGDSGVSHNTGVCLFPYSEATGDDTGAIWGVTASGTALCTFEELSQ